MIGRRKMIGLLSGAVAAPALLQAPALANEPREGDLGITGRGRDDQFLHQLRMVQRHRELLITSVFILGVSQLYLLRTSLGILQRNENRVDLSALPLLGALMQQSYSRDSFTNANRIGAAYAEGAALFIMMYPGLLIDPKVRQFVMLNTLFSYRFNDEFQAANWAMMAAMMPTFCALQSVRQTIEQRSQTVGRDASAAAQPEPAVLQGLFDEASPQPAVPYAGDVPVLKTLFAGHLHKSADEELLLLVRPSVTVGDSER